MMNLIRRPLRPLGHALIEYSSLVINCMFSADLREGKGRFNMIKEELGYAPDPLSNKEHRAKLQMMLEHQNAKTKETERDLHDDRPTMIYAVNAYGWDHGAIYNSTSVRAWHALRIKRLSKTHRVYGCVASSLNDIQDMIDALAQRGVSSPRVIELIGHGMKAAFMSSNLYPKTLTGLTDECDFIANACKIGSDEAKGFPTQMAQLNPTLKVWSAENSGGFIKVYFKGRGAQTKVHEVIWCDDLWSLIWARGRFKMVSSLKDHHA